MKRLIIIIMLCLGWLTVLAQSPYRMQYWFDGQYSMHLSDSSYSGIWQMQIDVGGLSEGLHTLYLHFQDTSGQWSSPRSYLFYNSIIADSASYEMTYTCWFDQDYSSRQSGNIGNGSLLLEVSQLSDGFHTVNIQLGNGRNASLRSSLFYKKVVSDIVGDTSTLYWHYSIDGCKYTPIEVSPNSGLVSLELNVAHLQDGIHTINYFFMSELGTVTEAKTSFFYKLPIIGNGLVKYDYSFNRSTDYVVNVPLQDTIRLITLLPVDSLPIRSTCFEYNPNNGSPVIYAKNDITFRFWNTERRFAEETNQYIDERVMQVVMADTLERDTTKVIPVPNNNVIRWFKLAAGPGDSLSFKTDRRCTMQLYAPSGEMVFHVSGDSVLHWEGCHAWENGDYYLAVHDAEGSGNISVSYKWIYKYAVLALDFNRVGNAHQSILSFEGNGFDSVNRVGLCHTQGDTLWAEMFHVFDKTYLRALFQFDSAETGLYDVVFRFNDELIVNHNGLLVVPYNEGELISTLEYPIETAQDTMSFKIKVTNTGNVSAISVPIQLLIKETYTSKTKTEILITSTSGSNRKRQHKINGGYNPFAEGLSPDEAQQIQQWVDDYFEDDIYFYKYFNDDGEIIRENTLFVDIDPQSSITITIAQPYFGAHRYVEMDVYIPKYNRYTYQQLYETEVYGGNISEEGSGEQHPIRGWWCEHHDKVECVVNAIGTILQFTGELAPIGYGISGVSTISGAISKRVCNQDVDLTDAVNIASADIYLAQNLVNDYIPSFAKQGVQQMGASTFIQEMNRWRGIQFANNLGFNITSGLLAGYNCYKAWWPLVEKYLHGRFEHRTPHDPNDITGYMAESGSHAISDQSTALPYTIEFENDSALATASARRVVICDTLDGNVYDLNSFSARFFSIGDSVVEINGSHSFTHTVDLRPTIDILAEVRLDYHIDTTFSVATWIFTSLDPMTARPTISDTLGFLAIGGTGEVNFTINRKAELSDSTIIDNRAWITFDNEEPIATSTWRNVIDATAPESNVDSVAYVGDTAIVSIAAIDNLSGVWRYSIYAQLDNDVMLPVSMNIAADSLASFVPPAGMVMLHSAAVDSAGNIEALTPIHVVYYDTLFAVVCDSIVWFDSTYTTSGEYVRTSMSAIPGGWDTLATLFLTVNESTSAVESVTACDSYMWNGTEYTASTTAATYSTTNAAGCDSIVTLHLAVNYSTTGDTVAIVCDSFMWHGTNYTASDTSVYTAVNAAGCDSTVTLHLTVNHTTNALETITACDSFAWRGTNYMASDTSVYTTVNAAGCDSTVTLHLTVNYSTNAVETVMACDSFMWHGTNYTASDTSVYTTVNAAGCDSTVTLHLTVNYSTNAVETVMACDSFMWHGTNYTASDTSVYTTVNAAGCDSTVTLHLTLYYNVDTVMEVSAVGGYFWNDSTLTQSGTYVWMGSTSDGCDSTVTLHLTVSEVGIDADGNAEGISVYPIPVSTKLHVESPYRVVRVELLTLTGVQLLMHSDDKTIDMSGFSEGMYLLRVITTHGIQTVRIIKQ